MESIRKYDNPLSPIVKVAMIVAFVGVGLDVFQSLIVTVMMLDPWGFYGMESFTNALGFLAQMGEWGSLAIFAMAMSKSQLTAIVPDVFLRIMFILCCCIGGLFMLSEVMPYDGAMLFGILGVMGLVGYVALQVLVYTKISKEPGLKSLSLWTMILFIVMGTYCIMMWVPFLNILVSLGVCASIVLYAIECNKYFGK